MSNADSRNLKFGIIGSLAVHLLAVLVFSCWVAFAPPPERPPHHDDPPVEVVMPEDIQVVPPPTPEPTPEPPKPKPKSKPNRYTDTLENEKEQAPPKTSDFISDRNTTAATKNAPTVTGDDPVPTSEGVKVKTMDLANREYKPGEIKDERSNPMPPPRPATPVSPPKPLVATPPKPPEPPQPPQPPQPKSQPEPQPKPPEPEKMAKKDDSSTEKMMKELDEALQKDNKEQKKVEIRKPDEPAPRPPVLKLPDESPMPPQAAPTPPPTPPSRQRTDKDEFVAQRRISEARGRITNVGPQNSVDAIETAEGRYVKQVKAAINERWNYHTKHQADFVEPCEIVVLMYLTRDGKTRDVRILSSNGNAVMTDLTLGSVLEAKIPPIPEDLRREMNSDTFEMSMDFVLY